MERKLLFLASLFVSCLLIANILASKLVFIWGLVLPAAVFVFPITFLVSDTISEVWGKKQAKEVIWLGFIMNLVLVVFLMLGRILPAAPFWEHQAAYEAILGAVPRIVLASMIAYLISQFHDVWSFHFWKKVTQGRFLWLRNNLSTLTSQLMDSIVFITIAFVGTVPTSALITMIFSQYIVKIIFALADTPFCYLAVKWANREEKVFG